MSEPNAVKAENSRQNETTEKTQQPNQEAVSNLFEEYYKQDLCSDDDEPFMAGYGIYGQTTNSCCCCC